VYYAPRYENTREFLRGEIDKDKLIPLTKLKDDVDSVINWWKPKAIARYIKLHEEGRTKDGILYYTNLMGLSWDEAKNLYLSEVGR
jgi:phage host-nuclease inhibitor protein Gam